MTRRIETVDVVFDGPPEHVAGRFVDVERLDGSSTRVGEWIDRGDGCWALRLTLLHDPTAPVDTPERMARRETIAHALRAYLTAAAADHAAADVDSALATPASSGDVDGLRDLMQRAIDRADPPGRMRTGQESVSVALLRGMLRDAAANGAPEDGWLSVLVDTAQDVLNNDGGYLAADERAQISAAVAASTPSTPGPLHWKLDSGRGAMLDERDRIVGYWTPPTALGLVVPHPEVERLRAEVENARCTIEADKRAMDELAAERDALRADMRPGRWWRSIEPDGSVWGESSDEAEIRRMARKRHRIQRCWQTETVSEWRDA